MKKVIIMLAFIALVFPFTAIEAQTGMVYTLPYTCGFDTTDLASLGWTTIDYNNDGYTWSTSTYGTQNIAPHNGSGFVGSASFVGGANGDIAPDNFLVSPRIAITDNAVLSWWFRIAALGYPADHYSVYISTTGNTAADFLATTPIFENTPTSDNYPIWNQESLDLSAYAGDTIYIAFRHHDCFGQYAILIDDVEVTPLVSPWPVADTMPWSTTFDTPDTGWTFIGRKNGWYIGAPGALNGSGGMYVSGDGGATNGYDRVAGWHSHFHWAVRHVHFSDSGNFRVDYDWKCDGTYQCYTYNNQTTCTYYDYVRVMLAPVTAVLDTEYFYGYGITPYTNNLLPNDWISLSDTNGMRLLANEAYWTHHAQMFHVPAAGDYLLLVLATSSELGFASEGTPPALDNLTFNGITCHNSIDSLRLTANSNQGLTVNWHDSQASQWAIYVNDSLYGTTNNTSFYLAGASLTAATCNDTLHPRIAISPICSVGDTALPVNIVGEWISSPDFSSTVNCSPFTLPYSENFDTYLDNDNELFGWYYFGGIAQYIENQHSHSGPLSFEMRAFNLPYSPSQISITPQMDAPGNRLTVSFWAKLPAYSGAATDTIFQAGVLFNHDTMDYVHVSQNITPMLTLRGSDADGNWHHYLFTTEGLDSTTASITFEVIPHSNSLYNCYIDDIEISMLMEGSVPPTVAIAGPSSAIADIDTSRFTATLLNGDTAGLTYFWRSSLSGMAMTDTTHSLPFEVVYSTVGIDTITLIATNLYGSDTSTHTITVRDNLYFSIIGTSTAYVGDTLHYSANLVGDTTNLTFSWHSSLMDTIMVTFGPTLTLVYTTTGTDTLTLTVVNAHGTHVAQRIVTVQSCGIIANFPYSEDFEGFGWQNRSACWLIRTPSGLIDNEWRRSGAGNNSSPYCMFSNGNSTNIGYEAWLITPAIELPSNSDSITFGFAHKMQYVNHFAILVSPTGDPWYDSFTDTLYTSTEMGYNTSWSTESIPLDAYRGCHIRLAFLHSSDNGSMGSVRIDDISITMDTSAVIPDDTVWYTVIVNVNDPAAGTASGDGTYAFGDTATLTATAFEGYHFEGWNITPGYQNIVTENPLTLIVTENISVIAYFAADSTEAIDDILPADIKVYSFNGRIVVEGADGEEIRIYDIMGRQISTNHSPLPHRLATVQAEQPLNTGIYLVSIGNRPARKVLVIR